MPQPKFAPGDIIEHEDGSLYVVSAVGEAYYTCGTILEMDKATAEDLRRGVPYQCGLEIAPRVWTKIGHIDGAV